MARLRETALYYEPEPSPEAKPATPETPDRLTNTANTAARVRGVKSTLVQMGVRIRNVGPAELHQPIGVLLGRKDFPSHAAKTTANAADTVDVVDASDPGSIGPIAEPVLLLDGFTGKRLDILLRELRKSGVSLPCKAVVTDSNIRWTFLQLYRELVAEREALAQGAPSE